MQNWLAEALKADNPAARGNRSDYDLNSHIKLKELVNIVPRAAAVLVPIIDHESGPTILLTKRAETLTKHAGQVSFPGGRVDDTDIDEVAAALRETEEEVGLNRSYVNVSGFLDTYRTGTGYEITPVVGLVQPGFDLVLEEGEVTDVFEVPLSFVLDRSNHQRESAVWKGIERHYYHLPYNGYKIWGATAAMLVNLCDVLETVKRG